MWFVSKFFQIVNIQKILQFIFLKKSYIGGPTQFKFILFKDQL